MFFAKTKKIKERLLQYYLAYLYCFILKTCFLIHMYFKTTLIYNSIFIRAFIYNSRIFGKLTYRPHSFAVGYNGVIMFRTMSYKSAVLDVQCNRRSLFASLRSCMLRFICGFPYIIMSIYGAVAHHMAINALIISSYSQM